MSHAMRQCPACQACWINNTLYWATGSLADEKDLAGLICNTNYGGGARCMNPQKGVEGGDTWAKREEFIRGLDFPGGWGSNKSLPPKPLHRRL